MEAYYNVAIYGPVLQDLRAASPIFDRPRSTPASLDLVENGTAPGAPDVYNTAYADFSANFIVPEDDPARS